jgi:hypothetical protein
MKRLHREKCDEVKPNNERGWIGKDVDFIQAYIR